MTLKVSVTISGLFYFLGLSESQQMDIFRILSGILHMGNILMEEKDSESCIIPVRLLIKIQASWP